MGYSEIMVTDRNSDYDELLQQVGKALQKGRDKLATVVNNVMVRSYWEIGRYIVEYEQKGHDKAEYGSDLLNKLSRDLTEQYGKGFSRSNVWNY